MTVPIERALVTGAGGFIGTHLSAALLQSETSLVALDLDIGKLERLRRLKPEARIQGDLGDSRLYRKILEGVTTVFNLGAAHLDIGLPDETYQRTNVDAVGSLAVAAANAGVRRFVHCSSVGVYGRIDRPPADEETHCRPRNIYERSKLAGEQALRSALADTGLEAVILRPTWVYGPACGRTHRLFDTIRRNRFLVAGDGRNHRHCFYIRDMVEALRRAAEVEIPSGKVIVVGDREATTVRELCEMIARLTGSPRPKSVPYWLVRYAAAACEAAYRPTGRRPPLSSRSLAFFDSNTSFDTSHARELLGCEPNFNVATGLEETWSFIDDGMAADEFDVDHFWAGYRPHN